jgi:hypothetical protein
MKRFLLLGSMVGSMVGCLLGASTPVVASTIQGLAAQASPNFICDGTYVDRTFKHVRVRPGDTCVLIDSTVTGNFMARDPLTVKVLDTTVGHNLMVRGATGDVIIGNRGCGVDPVVGNNIKVTKSHNVAICWMQTKNNLTVTRNDGRINVSNNDVGRNLTVSRNEALVLDPGVTHVDPGAIRVRNNTVGSHIKLFKNDASRALRGLDTNTPAPMLKQ